LVSDNASVDNTFDIVQSIKDPRVKYVNTGQSMSMTRNWEFALSHVKDGYVTFLGDDDGLVPNAVSDIADLIQHTGALAITWNKAEYHWPNHPNPNLKNSLVIPTTNVLLKVSAAIALRHAAKFWLPYNKLPTLYNSFVKYEAIDSAKQRNGIFFMSVTPDVYSGFALMKVLDFYLYSSRPFSVNGASASSNGAASISGNKLEGEAARFIAELDVEQNEIFQVIPGSIYSNVAEALLQANKYCFNSQLKVNKKLIIKLILRDIHRYLPDQRDKSLDALYKMVAPYGLKQYAQQSAAENKLVVEARAISPASTIQDGNLILDAEDFIIKDINGACNLIGNLLASYQIPDAISNYSFSTLILTSRCTDFTLYSGVKKKFNYYYRLINSYVMLIFKKSFFK
jgi:hypothetical protein